MNALVSVLIPIYNAQEYLEQCLESAINQTYKNIEIICCDDGSNDSSVDIAKRYAKKDSRIKLLENIKNQGVIYTRNRLLSLALGDYIAWLDSDDWISEDKIRLQLDYMRNRPHIGALGTGITFVDEDGNPYKTESYSKDAHRQSVDPEIGCATVLVRSDAAHYAGKFREVFKVGGEDGDWLLRIADKWAVTNIDEPCYFYRKNPKSLTHSNKSKIRKLGVLARNAAKARRRTGVCPIDSGAWSNMLQKLEDKAFIDSDHLSVKEKVTAVSLRDDAEPLVSLIIPYFNAEKFINQCLFSLCTSSIENFEVIICDDGSEKPLVDVLDPILLSGEKFELQIIRNDKNCGVANARNRCLELAKGKYISFLDSDDFIDSNKLELQLNAFFSDATLIGVGTGTRFVNEDGLYLKSEVFEKDAVTRNGFSGCCASFMIKRIDAASEIRFSEIFKTSSEDVDYLLLHAKYGKLINIDDVLYNYRLRSGSLTHSSDWQLDHASYMIDRVWMNSGHAKPSEMITFLSTIDGSQTADLWMSVIWRGYRTKYSTKQLILGCIIFRKSFTRLVKSKVYNTLTNRPKRLVNRLCQFILNYKPHVTKIIRKINKHPKLVRSLVAKHKNVLIYDNWGDCNDALAHLIPGGSNTYMNVTFDTKRCWYKKYHKILVLNHPKESLVVKAAPENICFAIGEPPTESHVPLYDIELPNSTVYAPGFLNIKLRDNINYKAVPCMTRSWSVKKSYDELVAMETVEKTKRLSWVTSNLRLLAGHRKRMDFLEIIKERVQLDLFGRGFREIEDKWNALAPYRYSIAFENYVAPLYFTEKIMDCFTALTVPLYYGSPDIGKYFPEGSYIDINPDDRFVVDKIIEHIYYDDYEARLDALNEAKYLVLNKYNMFTRIARDFANEKMLFTKEQNCKINKPSIVLS